MAQAKAVEPANAQAPEKLSRAVPLKKGDYSIHILLEEGRGFVPLKDR